MRRARLTIRRLRVWLARLILPANAVVWDLGPMVESFQQLAKITRKASEQRVPTE